MPKSTTSDLPSLTAWVQSHLTSIYDHSLPGADFHANFYATFSPTAQIMINHDLASHDTLMDNISRISGTNIEWRHVTELPKDIQNPNEAGIVAGVMVVTRTLKFRIRAGPAETQSIITFSAKVDQHPSSQADSNNDRRRIVHLFQTVVYKLAPVHFNTSGGPQKAGSNNEQPVADASSVS